MNYAELTIPCADADQGEIWMAELAELPFESFQQTDTELKAYIPEDELERQRPAVEDFMRSTGVQCSLRTIETVNWNAVWESEFDPVDVGGKCVIRAPFHDAPGEGVLDIVIMPKMSFGTGHHATTWLMTDRMLDKRFDGLRGLDMGSGTGVLAIVAARLGADHVDAVDIDLWAFENGVENVEANGVADRVTPMQGDVSAVEGRSYDFVLANINRNILLSDMGEYRKLLRPGGFLIVSGILEQDIDDVSSAAIAHGLHPQGTGRKDGWVTLEFSLTM